MRWFDTWVLAAALILAGARLSAQPAQSVAETPGAVTLPTEPPSTVEAIAALPGLTTLQSGAAQPGREAQREARGLMRRCASAERHGRYDGPEGSIVQCWRAAAVLRDPGTFYRFGEALHVAGRTDAGCAMLARVADAGGFEGFPADDVRREMRTTFHCPPPPAPVWANNPPVADNDPDGDGVLNGADQCPTEAAGDHPSPQRPGCADGDGDRDQVFDSDDRCPTTSQGDHPDPARRGCPLAVQRAVPAVTPPVVPATHTERRSRVHDVAPWVLVGAGGAALATAGVALARLTDCDGRIAANAGLQIGDRSCAEGMAALTNATLVVGGALVAGGVTWLIVRPARERQVQVAPQAFVSPTFVGAGATITF